MLLHIEPFSPNFQSAFLISSLSCSQDAPPLPSLRAALAGTLARLAGTALVLTAALALGAILPIDLNLLHPRLLWRGHSPALSLRLTRRSGRPTTHEVALRL